MQTKGEIESWYSQQDPWDYEKTPDDQFRKETILEHLKSYERALDIGAGEGWITQDIKAKEIHAIEWSDKAAERLKTPISRVFKPEGTYDLIMTNGTLYEQYNWQQIIDWLKEAKHDLLTCNIYEWEKGYDQLEEKFGNPKVTLYFPYRQYTQHLALWRLN